MSQAGQFFPISMLSTLTGDTGGAIVPVAGNIDILGGAGIAVAGTAGTLTISHSGVFSDSFPTDAGTAVPVAGDTNILGGANINTTGAGNTVTVVLDDSVSLVGSLTAGTFVTATTGDITAIAGNLVSAAGSVSAFTTVTAGTGIVSTVGDITANAGDVVAVIGSGDFGATVTGGTGVIATTGNVTATAGAGNFGTSLTVGTTVEFTTITNGGLISDVSGNITTSGALITDTGFDQWSGGGPFFDDTVLGSFEVLVGGAGYINGVFVSWASGQTVTGLIAGNTYLIYIDDTGTIGKTTTFSGQDAYQNNIPLFEVLRDSTGTNIQYTVKENHPFDFPVAVSVYNHDAIGTIIENQLQGANITLNGTQKIEIVGADELDDHGLHTIIPDGGGVAEVWNQMYTTGAGKWATYQTSDTFNGFWNSVGTPTAGSGNKFSIYTLYVSKDNITASTPIYWAVLDDQEYNNLGTAETAIAEGTVSLITAELAKLELAQLGHIIYQQSISTIVEVVIEKATLRSFFSTGGGTNLAALVLTDVTNFDGILSASDTTVQVALDTIDEWGLAQVNIYYVGKHGNDANNGLSINRAFLTFTAAQAAASSGDVVWCFDNGTYTENITGVAGITLYAPNANLSGAHIITTNNAWTFRQMTVATGVTGVTMSTGGQKAFINIKRMTIAGIGVGVICTGGTLFLRAGSIDVTDGFFVGSTTSDEVQVFFGEVHFLGVGTAFSAVSGGELMLFGDSVRNNGAGTGTLFSTAGGGSPIINATITSIDATNLSNITAGSVVCLNTCAMIGTLNETGAGTVVVGGASRIDGVPIGAGTPSTGAFTTLSATTPVGVASGGTGAASLTDHGVLVGSGVAAITPLVVGTNGQVIVGSSAADPVFATISSTDSSITITGGAGTLALTGTQSTTSQLGSVELATDAEAIAGSDTDRPIVPSSLTAKLGTQTDHGVLVGSGTTAAITPLAVGTNGQLLVGSTGADPVFATVASADGSVAITGGAGTIDLSSTGTIAVNNQTGTTYELVIGDRGKIVTCTNAAAITVTIPVNADVALAIGTNVLISQNGAGMVTLAPEGGVTLSSRGALLDTAGQYAVVSVTKIDTNLWLVSGDLA